MQIPSQSQPIPVVILCGGKGSRLKEETEFRPKPMVTIGGKPILWHIMKGYACYGYNHFILCLGYKGEMIKDYFLNHRAFSNDFHLDTQSNALSIQAQNNDDFKITFADTGENTLTGERLIKVLKYIPTNQFMVTYGDGVSDVDVRALHAFHNAKEMARGVAGTITGIHPRSKYGLIKTDDDVITEFKQYPKLQEYTNGGFMVFNASFLPYLKKGQMIEDAIIEAAADGKLALYAHDGVWCCMDTYQDMEELNQQWNAGEAKWKTW